MRIINRTFDNAEIEAFSKCYETLGKLLTQKNVQALWPGKYSCILIACSPNRIETSLEN